MPSRVDRSSLTLAIKSISTRSDITGQCQDKETTARPRILEVGVARASPQHRGSRGRGSSPMDKVGSAVRFGITWCGEASPPRVPDPTGGWGRSGSRKTSRDRNAPNNAKWPNVGANGEPGRSRLPFHLELATISNSSSHRPRCRPSSGSQLQRGPERSIERGMCGEPCVLGG